MFQRLFGVFHSFHTHKNTSFVSVFFFFLNREKLKTVWQAPPLIQLTCGYFITIDVKTHFNPMVIYKMGYFIVCTMISEKSFHFIFMFSYSTTEYQYMVGITPKILFEFDGNRKSTWEVNYMVERYLDVVYTWVK